MKIRYTSEEFRTLIKDFALKKFGSQRAAAKSWGVSEQFLSAVICGRKDPSDKIIAGVGATKRNLTTYIRKERVKVDDGDRVASHAL